MMFSKRMTVGAQSANRAQPRVAWYLVCLVGMALAVLAPPAAWAHEKWFVDAERYPLRWELLFSWPVALALGVAGLALGGLILLSRVVRDRYWPNPVWLRPVNSAVQAVVGIQTAISLVYMTVRGWLLAPTLTVAGEWWGYVLLVVQLFVAFTFVTGWLTRVGGGVLVGLVLAAFVLFPADRAAEQLLFVGIGAFFLIQGRGLFRPTGELSTRFAEYWSRYSPIALPLMRIFTGISILWLAFSEKLLNPQLAVAFLESRPEFNFMRLLGFNWFTDEFFIYAAAAVEATVGVLLIAGVLPRIVILFMWVPFNIAIPFLPPEELLGHLPILAVMYAVFLGEPAVEAEARRAATPAVAPVGSGR
ncbi:MAG: hypothetical protein M3441_02130 [Chloroflexota bacterium]|nr:hypothetical protein [Chloroflexota bacterium]